jgi:CO/xanthine dehydrogenase Mo-binding subunit
MRGFGVTIGDFALECQMDKIARRLGMHPLELRMLNAYRDGDTKAHQKKVEGAALVEVMQAAAKAAGVTLGDRFQAMSSLNREGV